METDFLDEMVKMQKEAMQVIATPQVVDKPLMFTSPLSKPENLTLEDEVLPKTSDFDKFEKTEANMD
jgi:hypothetical protein